MKSIIKNGFLYLIGIIGAIIVLPFVICFYLLKIFWHVFGATVIAFLIIAMFGGTIEECIEYGAGLGFFVGVVMKYRELN